MKIKDIIKEDDSDVTFKTLKGELPGPYKIIPGLPRNFKESPNTYVTVKTTEPRGIPAAVMKWMAMAFTNYDTSAGRGAAKTAGVEKMLALSGYPLNQGVKLGYDRFKPSGMIFKFKQGISQEQATAAVWKMLTAVVDEQEKGAAKRAKYKVNAPKRKKEASKAYAVDYKKRRQALYDKYGKRNVMSVTARQIGGDDGYQWNVLINGRPWRNGMTQTEAEYTKIDAYELLAKKYGVQ